jgi:hypothetical protein
MLNNYLTELSWKTKSFHLTIIKILFFKNCRHKWTNPLQENSKTTNLGGFPTLRKQTQTTTVAHYQWWVVGKLFSHL